MPSRTKILLTIPGLQLLTGRLAYETLKKFFMRGGYQLPIEFERLPLWKKIYILFDVMRGFDILGGHLKIVRERRGLSERKSWFATATKALRAKNQKKKKKKKMISLFPPSPSHHDISELLEVSLQNSPVVVDPPTFTTIQSPASYGTWPASQHQGLDLESSSDFTDNNFLGDNDGY